MDMPTSQTTAKPARKQKSPLRQLTEKLDKQVKKVETKKAQLEKLQASLATDQKEMQALLEQISSMR